MIIFALTCLFLLSVVLYFYLFYPRQAMPHGKRVNIRTPEPEKYMHDCLHPCIRYIPDGFAGHRWWMVQSPFYGRDSKRENPVLYYSDDGDIPTRWQYTAVVCETPETGYNSDPVIFYEDNKLWVFWREKQTPLCTAMKVHTLTTGVYTSDGITFSQPQVYLMNSDGKEDTLQCPILVRKGNSYYFYTAHYRYDPVRESIGLTIWKGTSLELPDFSLAEEVRKKTVLTCDKWKQLSVAGQLFFIPKPLRHDCWHFDLFEHDGKLYMISVAEWGDNIMLGVSTDFRHFRTWRVPLINAHSSEKTAGYRQYYYKPTGFVSGNQFVVYYTTNSKEDYNRNELNYSVIPWVAEGPGKFLCRFSDQYH